MKISVFGLGYVGCVSGACLSEIGHEVIGVDVAEWKVRKINEGKSPLVEKGLGQTIAKVVDNGKLRATCDPTDAVLSSSISMICVGTPSNENGSLNLDAIKNVSEQIGSAIKKKETYHTVVMRSTVLPGTVNNFILPIITKISGKSPGVHFGICINPEFMREGSSIYDFYHPPMILIGERWTKDGDAVQKIYSSIKAPFARTSIEASELVKYVCNVFHGLKIGFANEIGNICKRLGVDGQDLMSIFCMDKKLNISKAYLKPGFAFGGSCLPKDLRALLYRCKELDLTLPILSAILPSNQNQKGAAFDLIKRTGKRKVAFLGMSFKSGTDDLRESPSVELIEMLIGKGFEVRIYDKEVNISKLIGANKKYIEKTVPHINRLMKGSIQETVEPSDVVVISKNSKEIAESIEDAIGDEKIIIDLIGIKNRKKFSNLYDGISW